ncbi:MAG: sce7725 family protein [Dyella sp.]|uniref:sce7725 family protein n=1 Tax=Dyella sp. TaxID=1869338 RepID=UPI003F7F2441
MNYYPFFRGKQYELICLRENSRLISHHGFTPIIEPVKEAAGGLLRTIDALKSENARFLVVANPSVGHHADALPLEFVQQVNEALKGYGIGGWIYQIQEQEDLAALGEWLGTAPNLAVLHQGTVSAKDVAAILNDEGGQNRPHLFSDNCSTRYRGAFVSTEKIMLIDGFKKRKNSEYPEVEMFSELPVTYRDLGATGFGDYLIVGSDYSEGGGAAYAVAIHITYVDAEDDGVVYVRHFKSDTNDTPTDPAGKFREALAKLVDYCAQDSSKIPPTTAIREFQRLHELGHFPGLGYVKKLSMQHHLEMMGR